MKSFKLFLYWLSGLIAFLSISTLPIGIPFLWIVGDRLEALVCFVFILFIVGLWILLKLNLKIPSSNQDINLYIMFFVFVFFCSSISFTLRYLANVENYSGSYKHPTETVNEQITPKQIESKFLKTKDFIQKKFDL